MLLIQALLGGLYILFCSFVFSILYHVSGIRFSMIFPSPSMFISLEVFASLAHGQPSAINLVVCICDQCRSAPTVAAWCHVHPIFRSVIFGVVKDSNSWLGDRRANFPDNGCGGSTFRKGNTRAPKNARAGAYPPIQFAFAIRTQRSFSKPGAETVWLR